MHLYWKIFAWAGIAILAGLLLWLLAPMLLPFLIAMILAYFLDPVVRKLVGWGMSRTFAALLVALITFGTLLAAIATVVPMVLSQAGELLDTLPDSVEEAQSQITEILPEPVSDHLEETDVEAETLIDWARGQFGTVAQGLSGIISFLMFWVVMPVVTIYLMIDFPKLIKGVDDLLPRPSAPTWRSLARDIDRTLSGYIRGQSLVCVILMGYYSVALTLVGLPFSLIVGVVTGAVSFIPYIGMFIGTSLGMGAAIWQFWDEPIWIAAVGVIYALGLFVESEIMVPRLVGSAVNLHPVWMIFAVIAFGTIFGFVGALIAVPLAAVTGVVVRFLLDRYYRSELYTGVPENEQIAIIKR